MSLLKKFAIAATAALPLLGLAGCGQPTVDLCAAPTETTQSIGTQSYAHIFNGAANDSRVCIVKGNDLTENAYYAFNGGLLVVDGNVPDGAHINVKNGKMYVSGDVGAKARLEASVPENISEDTVLIPMMVGKIMMMMPVTNYNFDGFTYANDHDAAVMIGGAVHDNARVTSNHDINLAGDASLSAKFLNSRSEYNSTLYRNGNIGAYEVAPVIAGTLNAHL